MGWVMGCHSASILMFFTRVWRRLMAEREALVVEVASGFADDESIRCNTLCHGRSLGDGGMGLL